MKLLDVVRHEKNGRGVVVDNLCDDESRVWGVLFEGKRRNWYHYEDDLTLVDVTVLEGVVELDMDEDRVNQALVGNEDMAAFWLRFTGRRVRVTVEVIE